MLATYFVTSSTHGYRNILQSDKLAALFVEHLYVQLAKNRMRLHEYVVMPNHVHLIMSPAEGITLERAVRYIKEGFSFSVKKSGAFVGEVWHKSYHDRRIRDANEYAEISHYIRLNPVRRNLVADAHEFPYSSAHPLSRINPLPQWLKPL